MTIIQTKNVQKRYQVGEGTIHAVDGIDFSVRRGEFVTISGRSGSGNPPC